MQLGLSPVSRIASCILSSKDCLLHVELPVVFFNSKHSHAARTVSYMLDCLLYIKDSHAVRSVSCM